MQVIRLTRIGKQNQAAFRIVLAEKSNAVKGLNQEILGFYNPAEGKKIEFNKERIEFWISKGAQPSDSVASLLKTNGMSGMEKFMELRNKKHRSKSAPAEVAAPKAAPEASAPAPAAVEAAPVAEEPAAVAEEPVVAEAPAEETPAA
ncbi:MAG: 30S ribosomal protein S16 [Candidatus Gracilibacteria bacterium]